MQSLICRVCLIWVRCRDFLHSPSQYSAPPAVNDADEDVFLETEHDALAPFEIEGLQHFVHAWMCLSVGEKTPEFCAVPPQDT